VVQVPQAHKSQTKPLFPVSQLTSKPGEVAIHCSSRPLAILSDSLRGMGQSSARISSIASTRNRTSTRCFIEPPGVAATKRIRWRSSRRPVPVAHRHPIGNRDSVVPPDSR
jgi:hypothetical protein